MAYTMTIQFQDLSCPYDEESDIKSVPRLFFCRKWLVPPECLAPNPQLKESFWPTSVSHCGKFHVPASGWRERPRDQIIAPRKAQELLKGVQRRVT